MVVFNQSKISKKGGGWVFILSMLFFSVITQAKEIPLLKIKQSAQQIWQRQQLIITLELITKDPFARLEADDFQQKGWDISAFPLQRIEQKTKTRLILKWIAFPFIAGKQTIKLPEIAYRPNRGRKQLLTQLVTINDINIQVKKLPIYIPPTMPVGKIKLQNRWNNGLLINTQDLSEWKIHVIAKNVVKQTMPAIKQQIISNESLQILPIQSSTKVLKSDSGIINQRSYIIPFKAQTNGQLKLPKIELQYFEPESGKLQTARLNPPFVIALNHGLFWILASVGTFFILFVFSKILLLIINFIKKGYRIKQAIKLLDKAKNYPQLRSAIIQLAIVEGWDANLTLPKFLQRWENKFGKSIELEEKISRLQKQYFSGQD